MGCWLLPIGLWRAPTTTNMYVTVATDRMDTEDLLDVDQQIIDELENGRANAPYLAEQLDYSKQYVRERLAMLKNEGFVVTLGYGLYSLPQREE